MTWTRFSARTGSNAIIDHTLYWGSITNHAEGWHLRAILNSPELTQLVHPLMAYGKDERHIDKHVWKLPILSYNPAGAFHARLSELGRQQTELVARLDLGEHGNYIMLRQHVRKALAANSSAPEVADIVTELLG